MEAATRIEEELIKAVRSEQCLFDVKHEDYMRIKLKDAIWKRIAEALNFKNGNEAKKAWEKLRNNHRDALRRQKNVKPKSESGAVNIKPWRFQKHMSFLIPYMANRLTNTNVSEEIQIDEAQAQVHSDNPEIDIEEHLVEQVESQNTKDNQSSPTKKLFKRRRHKGNTLNDILNKTVKEHKDRVAKRQQEREQLANNSNDFTINNVKNDALFHFFLSMYETSRKLPPVSQHNIKTELFSLVSREESTHLLQYSPCSQPNDTYVSEAETCSSYTPQKLNIILSPENNGRRF